MALTFKHAQLPNGLDVVAEINPDAHSFAAGLFVKTGSRDEAPEVNGVSHFLEHMMFKGSDRYTWEDVNRIFDELGAKYNAYTTQEMTAYYANVLPEFGERAVEHLSHLLRPAIRQADFDTEKKVILEEIAMYLDDPGHRVYERLMEVHFGRHPLGASILGSAEAITNLKRDQMADYFRARYGPRNMVLSVTGQVDFDRVVDWAGKYMGAWEPVNAKRDHAQPLVAGQRVDLTDPKLNRQYTMGMTPGPSAQDDRRFAARVLSDVIGDAEGSRFYWALVDNAIAEDADFGFYPHDGCGSFYIALTTSPDRADEALAIANAELEKAKRDITDEEIERAKNKIASSLVLSGEVPAGRMRSIGSQWIYNKEYRSLEKDMATLQAVDRRTIRELMREYPFDPMTIVTLGPGKKAVSE
ncbi:MAG: FIG007959: peptidase, M16 family [uncultured Phycisphaerae bacterium]|uniref:FIG007959: peptidase, M16 family n=1 Tax=uncultured Phycisphaerae bacterium TaxID=904963 RepID=A0A6J4PJU0_9BACT|nr:MAG: FIG007959: peptidase, M16 family [uncultured Phycisphaerae bacterium]